MTAQAPARAQTVATEKYRMRREFHLANGDRAVVASSLAALPDKKELEPRAVDAFVQMGYLPGEATLFRGISCLPGGCEVDVGAREWSVRRRFFFRETLDRGRFNRFDIDSLVIEGARTLRRAVERALARSGQIVVPLSGGLDSRTLLAELLHFRAAGEISTYSYGVPGSADFEIGNAVARQAGTKHETIDLREVPYTHDRLLETAHMVDGNTPVFQPYVWTEVRRRFGSGATFWSGFTGDGIAGSFYQPQRGTLEDAVQDFIVGDCFFSTWQPKEPKRVAPFVATVTKFDDVLSTHEAVWFENHVERYTAHQIFMTGLRFEAPFMDDEFVRFMLDLPPRFREKKRLYERMVVRTHPRWFRLPTRDYGYKLARRHVRHAMWVASHKVRAAGYRLSPRVVHPETSYIDFTLALRQRPDVRSVVRELLDGLERRAVVDATQVRRLWAEQEAGARHTGTLLVLASLEAFARAYCE